MLSTPVNGLVVELEGAAHERKLIHALFLVAGECVRYSMIRAVDVAQRFLQDTIRLVLLARVTKNGAKAGVKRGCVERS
jgi:hypothetical protein